MAKIRAYFKLDLYLNEHPKVVNLSHSAIVLYVFGNAYCNRRQTDGFIAKPVLRRLIDLDDYSDGPSHHQLAEELVKAGLWHVAGEPCPQGHDDTCPPFVGDGWRVHDFLEHNDSSEERDSRRADDAARKRRARAEAKDRPDRPKPPSGGPSGNVRPDAARRPTGRDRPSAPIAVAEQNIERSPTHPEELSPPRAVPRASVENPSTSRQQPRRAKLVEPQGIGEAVTAIAGGRRPPAPTADQRRWREEHDKRAAADRLLAESGDP